MSAIYVYGSGECEQLGLEFKEEEMREIKRARKVPRFDFELPESIKVSKILCGGMHTVVLTNTGRVFTWGCNDEGALGRDGNEAQPMMVTGIPSVDGIAAGDSHSLVYNTEQNCVYQWGLYRNSLTGRTYDPVRKPQQFGTQLFKNKVKVMKIVSGSHHTLALTNNGKVYAWGDSESGKIGRNLKSRNKNQQALQIEAVGARNAVDVFCGNNASFYQNKKGQLFAWGLNNHGQLGIGHKENTCTPTMVRNLEGEQIVAVDGGEHHTIALTQEGKVYCWGRNDEGQGGLGDLFGQYRKEKAEEEQQYLLKGEEPPKQKKEPNMEGIYHFSWPRLVTPLWPEDKEPQQENGDVQPEVNEAQQQKTVISKVFAGSNYCYALSESENKVYSWGMGYNYVLGSRDEDNLYTPTQVHPKQFHENVVKFVGTGAQHIVVLTTDSPENKDLPKFEIVPINESEEEEVKQEQNVQEEPVEQKIDVNQVQESNGKPAEQKEEPVSILGKRSQPEPSQAESNHHEQADEQKVIVVNDQDNQGQNQEKLIDNNSTNQAETQLVNNPEEEQVAQNASSQQHKQSQESSGSAKRQRTE